MSTYQLAQLKELIERARAETAERFEQLMADAEYEVRQLLVDIECI